MSDGMSDSRREVAATFEAEAAGEKLAEFLRDYYDPAFGRLPDGLIEYVNVPLRKLGVKLVLR